MRPEPVSTQGKTRSRLGVVLALIAVVGAVVAALVAFGVVKFPLPSDPAKATEPEVQDVRTVGVVMDVSAPDAPSEWRATVLMAGDVLMHDYLINQGVQADGSRDYWNLFANTTDVISAADLAMVDQETPLGGESLGFSGFPTFNSPQEVGDDEVQAGFDLILSASNHTVDMGQAGVSNTLNYWRSAHPEISVIGMYDNADDYNSIYVYEKDGLRIAVLNYTYGLNGLPLPDDNPYAAKLLDDSIVADEIARANEMADVVVVCPHWGTEYSQQSDSSQRAWAQRMSDLGADVIFGGHPHVLEPVEVISGESGNQTLVFWSVGNYVSCMQGTEKATGGMAEVTLVKDASGVRIESWRLIPVVTHMAEGSAFTVYKLSDYTAEAAATSYSQTGSPEDVSKMLESLYADAYDPQTCVVSGGEVVLG